MLKVTMAYGLNLRSAGFIFLLAGTLCSCVVEPTLPSGSQLLVGSGRSTVTATPIPTSTPSPIIVVPTPTVSPSPSATPNLAVVDVVVGVGGVRASSIDLGHSWQVDNDNNPNTDCWAYRSLAYGAGRWVAVGYTGGYGRVSTTPDGVHWRHYETASAGQIAAVVYGNGKFVSDAFISTDGYNLTFRTINANVGGDMILGYINNHYVVTGGQLGIGMSTDGTNFTTTLANYTSPNNPVFGSDITHFAAGNGIIVGMGGARIATSSDNGSTWTNQDNYFGYGMNSCTTKDTCNKFVSIAYEGSNFVIYGGSGDYGSVPTRWTSTDGISWNLSTPAGASPYFMGGTSGLNFIGRTSSYDWSSASSWMYSSNGSTWTTSSSITISPTIADTSNYYLNSALAGIPESDPRVPVSLPASVLLTHAQVLSACGSPLPAGR